MRLINIEQNSEEWIAFKLGKFSASSAADLLMDKKNKGYQKLIDRIIEERITGKPSESKWDGNQFTERGHEYEPEARNDYEFKNLVAIQQVGVVEFDEWTVCSPDGLIDDDKIIQIKCPIFKTQREYIKSNKIPTNYYKQMQFELFVTGRKENIFYSYHPALQPVQIPVFRDEEMIAEIQKKLKEAQKEVMDEIKFLSQWKMR
jgi:putative phage-type endonuclease